MRPALALLCPLLACGLAAQDDADLRTTTWADGSLRERYTVDTDGNKHGALERWAENGTRVLLEAWQHGELNGVHAEWDAQGRPLCTTTWRKGVLHGASKTFAADGTTSSSGSYKDGRRDGKWTDTRPDGRTRIAAFKAGVLHGAVRVEQDRHTLSRQTWKDGELVELDGLEPFATPREQLLGGLRALLSAPPPDEAAIRSDPKAVERHAALQRLRAYRLLCRLRQDDLELIPEWNDLCDAAAEVCLANGDIDHHPPQPPGFDAARYRQGVTGASNSNLAVGGPLASSVDSYMDDSDPGNIDRIGHRRWCLNPTLKRLGFGTAGRFHAMWSMDSSGKAKRGQAVVAYPPAGYVPVDLFTARRAFSIATMSGGAPKASELRASIRPLDEDFVPGEPLELDALHVAGGGFGTGTCIVFRARGLQVRPGSSYLVEVDAGGKDQQYRYVVSFCEAAQQSH
ncbi:MAG: hypothetical protein H6835_16220 [Planctomycetes bacterium]|nr:hypothetical protein [Planctomycetota bacterium]